MSEELDRGAIVAGKLARGGVIWVAAGGLAARARRDQGVFFETAAATWVANGLAFAAARVVGRARPCSKGRRALIECPSRPSFPSEHAASAFAAALTLSRADPRLRPLLLCAATAVAASRVRVGVHYPTDVLAGAVLGGLVSRGLRPHFEPVD